MAAIVVPDEAKVNFGLGMITGSDLLLGAVMHIYQSPLTLDATTTLEYLISQEATYAEYEPVTIALWSTPPVMMGAVAQTDSNAVSFTTTTPDSATLWGIFVTDATNTRLLFACAFDSGIAVPYLVYLQIIVSFQIGQLT